MLALAVKTAEAIRIETTGQWGPCADVRRSSSQGAVLALAVNITEARIIETTGQWGPCAGVIQRPIRGAALALAAKARGIEEVHRGLAHQSKEITQKTAEAKGIVTTGHLDFIEARLQVKVPRQAVE